MTMQEFLADAAEKAAGELVKAYLSLPEDKRAWSPSEKSRSALDQVVECAILNGGTSGLLETRKWSGDMDGFFKEKARVSQLPWGEIQAMLEENTKKVAATIRSLPAEVLNEEIPMPWGPSTVASIASYPYWNMTYHLGQITYIASILGCLN